MKNIVLMVQARTSSTRFPRKVLSVIKELPYLIHMLRRVQMCRLATKILVITSNEPSDDELTDLCKTYGFPTFRGSLLDLLDRHYQAAVLESADIIVKVPSDCAFADSGIIDSAIRLLLASDGSLDYVSNYHPATFPDGLDVEVFTFSALHKAWLYAVNDWEREHTTPYIWGHPELFAHANILNPNGHQFKHHRWTLDYIEDLLLIKKVYEHFSDNPSFSWQDVLSFMDDNPDIAMMNSGYSGQTWYDKVDHFKTNEFKDMLF